MHICCHLITIESPGHSAAPSMNIPTFNPKIVGDTRLASAQFTARQQDIGMVPSEAQYNPAAALPPKLARRIVDLEFVEMSDLLPDLWQEETQTLVVFDTQLNPWRLGRKAAIQDISQWVECYSKMAAVLSARYPEKAPELWAYLASIVRAACNFEGSLWIGYDRQYRREALARRDLNWSQPCTRLYNDAFTGRAKAIPRCQHCQSDSHISTECALEPAFSAAPTSSGPKQQSQLSQEICRLYNADRCHHPHCRYWLVCQECSYQYPWTQCPKNRQKPGSDQRNRERSPQQLGGGRA